MNLPGIQRLLIYYLKHRSCFTGVATYLHYRTWNAVRKHRGEQVVEIHPDFHVRHVSGRKGAHHLRRESERSKQAIEKTHSPRLSVVPTEHLREEVIIHLRKLSEIIAE
jgi:hypothetical protein